MHYHFPSIYRIRFLSTLWARSSRNSTPWQPKGSSGLLATSLQSEVTPSSSLPRTPGSELLSISTNSTAKFPAQPNLHRLSLQMPVVWTGSKLFHFIGCLLWILAGGTWWGRLTPDQLHYALRQIPRESMGYADSCYAYCLHVPLG